MPVEVCEKDLTQGAERQWDAVRQSRASESETVAALPD